MTHLDERYGRRPPMSRRRRTALAVGGVTVLVLAVVGFYFWWASAQDPFSARLQAFRVVSDARVDVSVEVTSQGDTSVRCEVVAEDVHRSVVGTTVVQTVAPGPQVQVLVTQVPTTGRAVTADVRDCALASARLP